MHLHIHYIVATENKSRTANLILTLPYMLKFRRNIQRHKLWKIVAGKKNKASLQWLTCGQCKIMLTMNKNQYSKQYIPYPAKISGRHRHHSHIESARQAEYQRRQRGTSVDDHWRTISSCSSSRTSRHSQIAQGDPCVMSWRRCYNNH